MPIAKNRDEFLARISEYIGDKNSDEDIAFMEDMMGSYEHVIDASNSDNENWKSKYEENDAKWRKLYKSRFFSGGNLNFDSKGENKEPDKVTPLNIGMDDIFK